MNKTITINLAQLDHNRLNLITNEPITGLIPKNIFLSILINFHLFT